VHGTFLLPKALLIRVGPREILDKFAELGINVCLPYFHRYFLTHGPFRSERSGAERNGRKRLRSQSLKEKKVFYIITCTHGAERNGEWNGMEWNGMKQNETE
jgi:hypothetical protein